MARAARLLLAGAALLAVPLAGAQAQFALPGADPLGLDGPPALGPGGDFPAPVPGDAGAVPGGADDPDAPRLWQADGVLDPGRAPAGVPAAPFTFVPSAELQLGATDNVRNSRTDQQGDVFVRLNPRLTLLADTLEVRGAGTYAPRLTYYFGNAEQRRVDHLFNGRFLVTLVPDLLFVDVRGSGDARSVFGEFLDFEDTSTDRRNRVQTTNTIITPYVLQRFGGLATLRAGYTFRQSSASGQQAFAEGQSQPFFRSQDFVSHEVFAALRSGEDWGPLAFAAQTTNTIFEGSGIYDGAHRYIHTAQVRYALSREWAALATGGWQDERYEGLQPFTIRAPIWNVGLRFAPDEESFVTVRYGERDGFASFSLNASLPIGVRTRLFARYGEAITSSVLQASDLLTTIRVDERGNVVDTATGLPAAITTGTSLLATQSGLFKTRRAIAAVSQVWSRDTFTLSLSREERTPVLAAPGTVAFAQEATTAALSWSRALAPGTGIVSTIRYGLTDSDIAGKGTNIGFQTTLSRTLTPSLTGSVRYAFRTTENETRSGRATQNTVLVSLRQYF